MTDKNTYKSCFFCLALVLSFCLITAGVAAGGATRADKSVTPAAIWQPEATLAFVTGVLQWQDTSLASFTALNREDEKLVKILQQRGVPTGSLVFLQDEQATLAAMQIKLQLLCEVSTADSVFMFYYAGHGDRSTDANEVWFLNHDCDAANPATSAFSLSFLTETLISRFKGKMAILLADCCYSGRLNEVADKLGKAGIATLVLSSATGSNESTGEWTFTRSLNEILAGKACFQAKGEQLTVETASRYISYNMAYGEAQLANYYRTSGFPANLVLAVQNTDEFADRPAVGRFMLATSEGQQYKVRIIDQKKDQYKVAWIGCEPAAEEWLRIDELAEIAFRKYEPGQKIEVEWNSNWYQAEIIRREDIFHLIRYDDYDETWNEWVASDRIRSSTIAR